MARLRRSQCDVPGITRVRRGAHFAYRFPDGAVVREPELLQRIRELSIPPAWTDVWICPWSNGHVQALGTDAAGRREYRYHDDWRRRRNAEKFDKMLDFARSLPELRRAVAADIGCDGLGREPVLATAVRLIDLGMFRVGGESYADEHETYGVATLLQHHVRVRRDALVFSYPAKGGIERTVVLHDPQASAVVGALRRRRTGGDELLAWKGQRAWHDVQSTDVNAYIKAAAGPQFTAKDFRTWTATCLVASHLASNEHPDSLSGRKRAVAAAVREAAAVLGNTPAVCRSSYVDPRVIDRFDAGQTIDRRRIDWTEPDDPRLRPLLEAAVAELLAK